MTTGGIWSSKVHFSGSSQLDVDSGGVIAYPVWGAGTAALNGATTATNLTAGSTVPFNDGMIFISRAVASTAFKITLPPPVPGAHLDIIVGTLQATSGIVDIDAGASVNILYGSSACEFIIATSAATTGQASLELVGLTTATWGINGISPTTGFTIQGTS